MFRSTLKIADIIIQMDSFFPIERLEDADEQGLSAERFENFYYTGKAAPDIKIHVKMVGALPVITKAKPLFITRHFQDNSENWRLIKKGNSYVYKSPLEEKRQVMVVNETFNKVDAYILPKIGMDVFPEDRRAFIKAHKGMVWSISDIIYDFLQVLLINYFAQRNLGIFTHAIGLRDFQNKGLIFAGKSGAGKSTMARLWHKHTKAMVLNDDRVIVRKLNKEFFIYGSPWHGEFDDYLVSRIESARLERIFFIRHSLQNKARLIGEREAFNMIYQSIFPTFWDRKFLENIASFSHDLIKQVPCYDLGFVNDKRIIDFARKIYESRKD